MPEIADPARRADIEYLTSAVSGLVRVCVLLPFQQFNFPILRKHQEGASPPKTLPNGATQSVRSVENLSPIWMTHDTGLGLRGNIVRHSLQQPKQWKMR